MTRTHFEQIARIIYDNTHANDEQSINKSFLVKHLCEYFESINDRFDEGLFRNACKGWDKKNTPQDSI
jgi:hypothetical protein